MTETQWPWSVLEIGPTDDRKRIREAYSRKLKALDRDAAPELFMELRDARDAAMSGEFLDASAPAVDRAAAHMDAPDDLPATELSLAEEPVDRPRFTVEYDASDDARFQRVADLLTGEGALTEAELSELDGQLGTLFADDRMGDLGHYARIEIWLAELLAQSFPRGAALFPRVAERFQWHERAHELGIHPAIPWLVATHAGQSFVDEIRRPDHAYHPEWSELVYGTVKGPLWWRRVNGQRMANLIATVRREYPWLEQDHWQHELVERWEKKTAGGGVGGPSPWIWVVMASIFIAALPRCTPDDGARSSASAELSALETELADRRIEAFLERNFALAVKQGLTIDTVRADLPDIHASLRRRARNLSDAASEAAVANADHILMKDITDGYYRIIDKLPHGDQVIEARYRAAAAKKLRVDPQGCAAFLQTPEVYLRSGNAPLVLSNEYRTHIYTVLVHSYAQVEDRAVPKEAMIPGDLMGKLIEHAGLPEKRVVAALKGERLSEADFCVTMGALYELLAEAPREQASKILPAVL